MSMMHPRPFLLVAAAWALLPGSHQATPPSGRGQPLGLSFGSINVSQSQPVKICFELPSTKTGVVGVTVAVVDSKDPTWIITHVAYAQPFNTTAGKAQQGCVAWDGLDENFWPIPPGTYGLTGIVVPVTHWDVDNKHHALLPRYTGSVSPVPPTRNNTASKQQMLVQGDACGNSFSSVGISTNFPSRPDHANFYHSYLENAFNNYLLNVSMPHGEEQAVWRWHDAGIGGGKKTATNGHSVWSWTTLLAGSSLYRGDVGDENVAEWGGCNASEFRAFPGINCLPAGTVVLDMEVVPGAGVAGNNSAPATAVWVLTSNANSTAFHLTAYDGYARDAPVLHSAAITPVAPSTHPYAAAAAMAIRNGVIHILSNDTTVRKITLDPSTGLPSGAKLPVLNLTTVLNTTQVELATGGGTTGPIAVDARGTLFVYIEQRHRIEAVNTSGVMTGGCNCGGCTQSRSCGMAVASTDSSGVVTATPAGVQAMATWVDRNGHSKLVVLEGGGARRFLQFDYGNATLPTPQAKSGKLDQVWNDIAAGSDSGWVFDPETRDYGWVTQRSPSHAPPTIPSTYRWGDLIKVAANATDGDWKMDDIYAGVGCTFLLTPDEVVPAGFLGGGQPALVMRHGVKYLIYQNTYKTVLKWNTTRKVWVPSAGLVLSFYNDSKSAPGDHTIAFNWHDANNDGSWRLGHGGSGGPDFDELTIFRGFEATDGGRWTFLADLVQDDLSFVGITRLGYWHWEVVGWDQHDNPIYADKVSPLLNDTVMAARAAYNASTMHTPCPKCAGLPPTRGGNEVGSAMGDHSTGRFVDAQHDNIVVAEGKTGSMYLKSGCFSADSCPQWKLAWYAKDKSGAWVNKWRVGRVPIASFTGAGQFAGLKMQQGAGEGVEPMWVNPVIGNLVSVMDGMRSGILVYTTDGLYIDTLFVAGGGAPGYRPGFKFGSATVYNTGGESFGYGEVYLDQATGRVMVASGKTTMIGFEIDGWSSDGIAVLPLVFQGGAAVTLEKSNVADPPGIAGQCAFKCVFIIYKYICCF